MNQEFGLKDTVSMAQLYTDTSKRRDKEGNYWTVYDSGLTTGNNSMQKEFKKLLPEGVNIKEFIEQVLSKRRQRVGLEIGGPGNNLFAEFTPGFFKETRGVILAMTPDLQISEKKRKKSGANPTHQIIKADAFTFAGFKQIQQNLPNGSAHLVIERMSGGIRYLPTSPDFLYLLFNRWYKLLKRGGLMFAESPSFYDASDPNLKTAWEYLNKLSQYFGAENFKTTTPICNEQIPYCIFRLIKPLDAPDNLPTFK